MDSKTETTHTYNSSAEAMALKFNNIGARISDVKELFSMTHKENPFVVEIGCGNGRDAVEICKHTHNYIGLDISESMITLARKKVPNAHFEVADIEQYEFPQNIDLIFAFASLIHTPKETLKNIFSRMHDNMAEGGLVRIAMKWAEEYYELRKTDEFGTRTYYYYSIPDIEEIAGQFTFLKKEISTAVGQQWIEVILQK